MAILLTEANFLPRMRRKAGKFQSWDKNKVELDRTIEDICIFHSRLIVKIRKISTKAVNFHKTVVDICKFKSQIVPIVFHRTLADIQTFFLKDCRRSQISLYECGNTLF